jgi:hypothetical protein
MFMFYIYVAHYNSESFSDMMYPGLNNRYEYALPMARGDSALRETKRDILYIILLIFLRALRKPNHRISWEEQHLTTFI